MSQKEYSFLRWFGGIASIVLAAAIIGLVVGFKDDGVRAEQVKQNKTEIIETKDTHKNDMRLMRDDMKEIIEGQKIMQADIKKLLIKTGGSS